MTREPANIDAAAPAAWPDYPELRVVVGGGSTGIGFASAMRLAEAGVARLALLSRTESRLRAATDRMRAAHPGVQVEAIVCDALDPSAVEEAMAAANARLGGIDVLVSSVSAPAHRPELLHDIPLQDVPDILGAQALPPMLLARAALPVLRERGRGCVISVASDAAKAPTPGESVLGAAMAAIVMFTQTLAVEGKRDGIRANVLTPSLLTGTPTTERALRDGFSRKLFEKAAAQAALGVASAEDQAELVAFLAGPGAARVTGQAISVNGGISAL